MFTPLTRRTFLHATGSAFAVAMLPRALRAAEVADEGLFRLRQQIKTPVKIASIEVVRINNIDFVRSRSTDGAEGLAITNGRADDLLPFFQRRVVPYFIGKDGRDIESLVDGVYLHQANYKYAGMAFWCCVGWAEFSLMDMLGKLANKSIGELLGGVVRKQAAVYMSSLRRDTTPQQEVDWIGKRVAETGAKAIKLKIGGRMSRNADAAPGRSEQLVALARKTFGDGITIYVDANGSYDSAKAIEVGKMLEAHNVAWYEEPCPFEEYDQTKRVADALKVPVAGGEQDTSFPRFRQMIRDTVVDIVQPDLNYNGGFIRTIRVANLAASRNMPTTPHSPKADPNEAYVLHFVSRTPNAGPFQEYDAAPRKRATWYTPSMEVKNGMLEVPTGPGLGITIDPAVLAKAEVVKSK
jgi:L-alanine-DL-glutamate epimerase-like enolase superfamily enzyme